MQPDDWIQQSKDTSAQFAEVRAPIVTDIQIAVFAIYALIVPAIKVIHILVLTINEFEKKIEIKLNLN